MKSKLTLIQEEWAGCVKCGFTVPRSPMLGNGKKRPEILIIEDTPHAEDYTLFGGDRGAFFGEVMKHGGLETRSVYFLTLVACRNYITIEDPDTGEINEKDAPPKAELVKNCLPRVHQMIYALDPKAILIFGDASWRALVADKGHYNTATQAAGNLFTVVVPGVTMDIRYPALVFPASKSILANPSAAEFAPQPSTIKALRKLAKYLSTLEKSS